MWYTLLAKIVVDLIAWLFKPVTPRVLDGAGPGELEEDLRERLEDEGW